MGSCPLFLKFSSFFLGCFGFLMITAPPCQAVVAVSHAEDIEISLCDGNSEDERRRRKIGSLRRKAIHALKKRGRRRVDFRFPPAAISIEDVRDAEEERAVAAFRDRLSAHGLLPDKHDDYHMMLRSCCVEEKTILPFIASTWIAFVKC